MTQTNEEVDLKLKMGSKDEVLWTQVKKEAEVLIENHTNSLKIQKAMLALAKEKILEEQTKWQTKQH